MLNCAFYGVISAIIFFFSKFAFKYLFPFLIGFLLAFVFHKPAQKISKFIKIKIPAIRTVIVALFFIIFVALFSLLIWFLSIKISDLTKFLKPFAENLISDLENTTERLKPLFDKNKLSNFNSMLANAVKNIAMKAVNAASGAAAKFAASIPGIIISFIITLVASCYTAKDYEKIIKFFEEVLSEKQTENLKIIKNIFSEKILHFLKGYFLLFLITSGELTLGLFIIGIKNFFIVALIIAVIDFLPVLGTGTVLIPWSIILLIQKNFKTGIMILILYIVITFVRNFAEPKIIGDKIGLHPLIQLAAIFVGLKLSGIVGMFILPLVTITALEFVQVKYKIES